MTKSDSSGVGSAIVRIRSASGRRFGFVLLTGVRVTELTGAELKEFERLEDAENATWTIPARRSKNGKAHVVPLSGFAQSIVADLVKRASATVEGKVAGPFPLAFPRRFQATDRRSCVLRGDDPIRKRFERRDAAQEFRDDDDRAIATWLADRPSAHDLRRTLSDAIGGSRRPAEDISACLNHLDGVTARHYDLYDRAREKRAALCRAGGKVVGEESCRGGEAHRRTAIRRARANCEEVDQAAEKRIDTGDR